MIMRNGFFLDNVPNQLQLDFFEEFFRSKKKVILESLMGIFI